MKTDRRLSGVLHALLHLASHAGPVTSERLARAMGTHAVVVRRTLAGLRDAGIVCSGKGHGGGWRLAAEPARITLRDVYVALGEPTILAMGHRTAAPSCRVEQAVNAALDEAFERAVTEVLARLGEVTLATLSEDLQRLLRHRKGALQLEAAHG